MDEKSQNYRGRIEERKEKNWFLNGLVRPPFIFVFFR
jgi:hypothetical protein